MKTKLQLECELLMVDHDIKHNRGNMSAFNLRANMATDPKQKADNITSAAFYQNRKLEAESKAEHLRTLIEQLG